MVGAPVFFDGGVFFDGAAFFAGERKAGFLFRTRNGKPLGSSRILRRHLHPALKQLGFINPFTGALTEGMVREARERWEASGRTPGFEGMARMLELAFKLKQFAAGMPSEIREVNTTVTGTVDVDWEIALRRAYGPVAAPPANAPAVVDVEAVPALEDKR